MKILLPNAKELNTNLDPRSFEPLSEKSHLVAEKMRSLSEEELAKFYKLKLEKAQLEWDRWFRMVSQQAKSYPAWQLYDGLMYRYMKRQDLSDTEVDYLSKTAFIATGLYGLISVFDLISPHRLDFQGSLKIGKESLKQFWRPQYDQVIVEDELVISLLSSEFEAVFSPKLQAKMIKLVFMEDRKGVLKTHSTISKKGRGRFLSAMAEQSIVDLESIKSLKVDGFTYRQDLSAEKELVFVREAE